METTRTRILDTALRLFSEHGYRGATTAEIARTAGVAEGTIYRYFKDKKELFLACVDPVIQEALEREKHLPPARSPRERVRQRIKTRVQVIRENLPVFNILFTEARFHPEIADFLLLQAASSLTDAKRPTEALMMTVGLTAAIWAMVAVRPIAGSSLDGLLPPDWSDHLDDDLADFFADAVLAREHP